MEHRVSSSQLEELLNHLDANRILAKGVGLGPRSKENIDREWNILAQRLNAHGSGTTKTGHRWKRYWHDLKHKTKLRAARLKQEASGTGGGPPNYDDLSETDKKVMAIIGEAAVFGDTEHRIPVFPESNAARQSPLVQPPDATNEVEIEDEQDQAVTPDVEQAVNPVHTSPSTQGYTDHVYHTVAPDVHQLQRTVSNSPSTQGHTDRVYTSEISTSVPGSHPDVQQQHPISAITRSPVSRRRTTRPRRSVQRRTSPTRVDPEWVIDLERRRVAAEEKLAEAALIMARAAETQAQASLRQNNIMEKLLNIISNK